VYISTPKLTQTELLANMAATASKLAGRDVIVRIKEHPGALGLAQRDLAGRAVIDITPGVFANVALFAETFAHEVAHIKLHFHDLPRRDIDAPVQKQIARAALHMTASKPTAYKRQEDEADTLAARWMATLREHHSGYTSLTGDAIYSVLQVLYHKAK
jgi:hypothetical protein